MWFPSQKLASGTLVCTVQNNSDDAFVLAGISELAGLALDDLHVTWVLPPMEMTWGAQAAGSYIWPGFCMYLCSNTPFSQVIPVKTPWGLRSTLWYALYFLNILFNTHIVALFVRLGSCSLIQHFTFSLISKHINELCSETWRRTFRLLSRTAVCSFASVSISRRAVMCSD